MSEQSNETWPVYRPFVVTRLGGCLSLIPAATVQPRGATDAGLAVTIWPGPVALPLDTLQFCKPGFSGLIISLLGNNFTQSFGRGHTQRRSSEHQKSPELHPVQAPPPTPACCPLPSSRSQSPCTEDRLLSKSGLSLPGQFPQSLQTKREKSSKGMKGCVHACALPSHTKESCPSGRTSASLSWQPGSVQPPGLIAADTGFSFSSAMKGLRGPWATFRTVTEQFQHCE